MKKKMILIHVFYVFFQKQTYYNYSFDIYKYDITYNPEMFL